MLPRIIKKKDYLGGAVNTRHLPFLTIVYHN